MCRFKENPVSIRFKIMLMTGVILGFFLTAVYTSFSSYLLQSADRIEEDLMNAALTRSAQALQQHFVSGKKLGIEEVQKISKILHHRLQVFDRSEKDLPADVEIAHHKLVGGQKTFIQTVGDQELSGTIVLSSHAGGAEQLLRVIVPQTISQQARRTLYYVMIALIATFIVVMGLLYLLIDVIVSRRLILMEEEIENITLKEDLSRRVVIPASGDEMGRLMDRTNEMLIRVESRYNDSVRKNRQLQRTAELLEQMYFAQFRHHAGTSVSEEKLQDHDAGPVAAADHESLASPAA